VIDVGQIEQFKKSKYNTWFLFHKDYFLIKDIKNFIAKRGKLVDVGDRYV
jgi:hypothetical protein